ncbi:hypothetical protein TREMEDRAFT_57704 [Tremella mesenterica DSM 1558]|uniref:uncharacterized protein n=1 Tax=Tremella mesenterica (strain ATCC 24925 / CBS 8224 / DSM 1558 / NBRC 9311 / NRRL Y-6157 / RJB 2259-6 / UBC 559-6) TaxID=578456 RepID=UPI00032BBAA1|nr:uncharacterized protein TREMEDRAFT_57704 [Tremella mesenterica DSM 1558]EIW66846.1 hypothetical protein TREMEDRAFT_57704 [Tremella mesenterica DSM 1558]
MSTSQQIAMTFHRAIVVSSRPLDALLLVSASLSLRHHLPRHPTPGEKLFLSLETHLRPF